ncbi:hypothetical protein AN476_15375 [Phaeobacter sp. 11ANDIMAR09]|nr:hypothetical protein AN476_15375 [Phaeobacter sp. 11ANDIMAR09]
MKPALLKVLKKAGCIIPNIEIHKATKIQERVQILPGETALQLWKRSLAPLGVELLSIAAGHIKGAQRCPPCPRQPLGS